MANSTIAAVSVFLLGFALPGLAPAVAAAQGPGIAFDQLHRWLTPGDTVWLTDAQGRGIKGAIKGVTVSFSV